MRYGKKRWSRFASELGNWGPGACVSAGAGPLPKVNLKVNVNLPGVFQPRRLPFPVSCASERCMPRIKYLDIIA